MSKNYKTFSAPIIIQNKRDGKELTREEINWFINQFTKGKIPDYQMSSLLMAIYIQGCSVKETSFLTDTMLYSGDVLEIKDETIVDKHSTGGVGDKTSFIVAPIAAACGVKVPMVAGRGLGHTGGTVDKIESISGFQTQISFKEFSKKLMSDGLVLIGQTKEIAPADRKIYALRDVTATIESIPLITASIMSKKLAEGAQGIVLDVKTGPGAFMKKKSDSKKLAKSLRDTAKRFNRNMMTTISDMSQPLGFAVGHSLELIECIETLKGKGPKDLKDLSLHLAGGMIYLAGKAKSLEEGIKLSKKVIKNGKALEEFEKLIKRQGGNNKVLKDYKLLPVAKTKTEIKALQSGYISQINPIKSGLACVELGGGRKKTSDKIDYGVGFIFKKKIGNKVQKGETLLEIHHNDSQTQIVEKIETMFHNEIIKITTKKPIKVPQLIQETHFVWR